MAWQEIGDRVFTRRFQFFDQQIGVVLGGRDVLLVDTRSTPAQAREIAAELRELTREPVSVVVDTHWHFDHTFGNSVFRPATIWGHVRAAEQLLRDGPGMIEEVARELPEIAAEVREVVIDPPERTFEERATIEVGDRVVELSYHGRAHTDGDIAIVIPDADVLFAGDLLEEGAPPSQTEARPPDHFAAELVRRMQTGQVRPATVRSAAARSSRTSSPRSGAWPSWRTPCTRAASTSTRPSQARRSARIRRERRSLVPSPSSAASWPKD